MPRGVYKRRKKDKRIIQPEMVAPLKSPHAMTLKRGAKGTFVQGTGGVGKRNQHNATLSALIREIGNELVEGSAGWTRIEAVIRTTYVDAMNGNNGARELLMERGWGKVPTPVELDFKGQFLTVSRDMGLTQEDVKNDPILAILAESSDVILENLPLTVEAPERGQSMPEYARKENAPSG